MNLILLGAPGSGKGTLAKQIAEKHKHSLITMGDILRNEKNSGSEIGLKIMNIIGKGNLLSDDIVNSIAETRIPQIQQPFILDGYPRTVGQADFIGELVNIDLAVYLTVNDETIRTRILERGKTSQREDDQEVSIINRRIAQFKSETEPLVDYYRQRRKLVVISGEMSIEDVFKQFEVSIEYFV